MEAHAPGEICARHYVTRQPVRVRWAQGKFIAVDAVDSAAPDDLWIAPPLFDIQVNGFGGVDFQQDDLKIEDLMTATTRLRQAGCSRFLLTLISDDWPRLTGRLRHLRSLRAQHPHLQAAIAGWHIEGPFLSSEPGFHGAHNPASMRDPAAEFILELRSITGNDLCLLTLAPERQGAIEAIALAVSRGLKISLGHTNASANLIAEAVKAGASAFTHLGNGCPRELDRHDNILWRVFETPGLMVSLIPDRIHVSPPLFRLIHRVLGPASICYTSDAMSAAGVPPGRYRLGKLELEVGADQIVRQPGKPLFAGSALRPVEGIFRAADMLGTPWQEAWPRFSETPARLLGLKNQLAPGEAADFCLLRVNAQNQFSALKLYSRGQLQSETAHGGPGR
jgi:N-acetylglucosamine-6-phosphate deacetylase